MEDLIRYLADLPPALLYLVIGAGAAVENIVPPIPADTFVLLGAFLAEAGRANPYLVFVFTFVPNVATAILTYGLARKHGSRFFQGRFGGFLLNQHQLEQVGGFYARWGTPAIFVSRFLPAFRAIVPIFAGVSGVSLPRMLIPLATASALWYGALVYLGILAGRNFEAIMRFFDRASLVLLIIAAVLIAAVVFWWWRTRRKAH